MQGRWGDVAEMAGGVAGGFAVGKVTQKYRGYGVRWTPADLGPKSIASERGATTLFNFELVTPEGRFAVANHGSMPAPRPGEHSHHGVMSRWMESRFKAYDPELAPAVLMPDVNHRATFGVYNRWRAEMRAQSGGTFDWANVSEVQIRTLGSQMFDVAKVPSKVQSKYWLRFDKMKTKLGE
jgi:HNH/Endo VII superfamily toxin with a SHH signature